MPNFKLYNKAIEIKIRHSYQWKVIGTEAIHPHIYEVSLQQRKKHKIEERK